MTAVEPTRERVEAYEKALDCGPGTEEGEWCDTHLRTIEEAGCPMAVAAARVEAERVAEVEAQRDAYHDSTHLRRYRDRALAAEVAAAEP